MSRMNVDERRGKLVDAAIEVMSREGVSHATTRAIVTEAGMTTGAFHYCFFSKEELVLEVMRVLNAQAFKAVRDQVHTDPGGVEVIDRGVGAYVAYLGSDASRRQLGFELTLHALREPGLRDAGVKHYRDQLDGAEELLTRVARAGGFTWRRPPAEIARVALGLVDGLSYQWLVTQEEIMVPRLCQELISYLHGQVAPAG